MKESLIHSLNHLIIHLSNSVHAPKYDNSDSKSVDSLLYHGKNFWGAIENVYLFNLVIK